MAEPDDTRDETASNGAVRRVDGVFARGATASLGVALLGAIVASFAAPACLERRTEQVTNADVARCTSCHGDAHRAGDYLRKSAPPIDISGNTDPSYPGVGAHDIHLNASSTHAAFACDECHVVPTSVDSPGHADTGPPAEVTFGTLATTSDYHPAFDPATQVCGNSYCHRDANAVWSLPRSSADACGTCHGLPPALPHPQSDKCYVCHADVIDEQQHIINPSLHVDGMVEYKAGDCKNCHGSDANPAPPVDTLGNSDFSALGVGAHQVHLSGGEFSRPLQCGECHIVPEHVEDPTHIDAPPAEVIFSGVAQTDKRDPNWDHQSATCTASYCHGPSPSDDMRASPVWNVEKSLDCTSCHGLPPPLPHPQTTNCSACHGAVVGSDNRTIIDRNRHVDGNVDLKVTTDCTACHGSLNPAPPVDTLGDSATTFVGVGAHQTHVLGTETSRAVPCDECHVVPKKVLDAGHLDSALPAELTFSGVAVSFGAKPEFKNGKCVDTSCHGDVTPDGYPMGGTNLEPTWTKVDGTQAKCGSCHGLPPPAPHPLPSYPCSHCHEDIAEDGVTFTHPELHVDGNVTFQLQ
jgi:predicted CxxxxCH...CXXCH cytochrome family protein